MDFIELKNNAKDYKINLVNKICLNSQGQNDHFAFIHTIKNKPIKPDA